MPETPSSWKNFYEKTISLPPSAAAQNSMKYVLHKDTALDLGCGALRDTRFLLDQGFAVDAVDQDPNIQKYADALDTEKIHVHVDSFDSFVFKDNSYDVIIANNSLPFGDSSTVIRTCANIQKSLKVGGIFSGSFFGPRDDWSHSPHMTFLDERQIRHLFEGMEIVSFSEEENDDGLANGQPKHWHIYRVIARKV